MIKHFDSLTNSNTYYSLGKPHAKQKHEYGRNQADVALIDLLLDVKKRPHIQKRNIQLHVNHFENQVLNYVATLTKQNRLIFCAMEQRPGT